MRPDAPALLVEHRVVDHAADGQLGVLLDRIVLEVLVAAVAVEQVAPVRVALADAAAERERHRGATRRRAACSPRRRGWPRASRGRPGRPRSVRGTGRGRAARGTRAPARGPRRSPSDEREGLEPRRAHAEPQRARGRSARKTAPLSMPPEKQTPIGSLRRTAAQPLRDLVGQGADVAPADRVEVRRQHARARGVKKRVYVGLGSGQPMSSISTTWCAGHHARVARVELVGEALAAEPVVDRVDAVGDDEGRARARLARK